MKTTLLVTLLSGLFLVASANAEEKTLTPQQQRMTPVINRRRLRV